MLAHDAFVTRALPFGGLAIPEASVHHAFRAFERAMAKVESSDRLDLPGNFEPLVT